MKFIVNRNNLLQTLLHTRCHINSTPCYVFRNIYEIAISGSQLTVSGTDGIMFKTEQIELEEETKDESRTFHLDSVKFIKAIKSLSDQPLEFLVEEYQLTVNHAEGYFRMPLIDAQYPEPRALTDDHLMHLHLEAPGLRSQLSKVVYATANDDLRPVMNGVLMEIDNNSITYIATDGHYLARLTKKCHDDNGFISSFIIPRYAVNTLLKVLPPTGYCELYFQTPTGDVKFPICKAVINDTLTIQFDCIDGRYPNYKNVIPTDFTQSFLVDRRQLIKILDRMSLFAPDSRKIKLLMDYDSKIGLESSDADEECMSCEQIPCTFIKKASTIFDRIYVNVNMLVKVLRNLCGDDVQFNLIDRNKAFTICPVPQPDVEDILALMMPMHAD